MAEIESRILYYSLSRHVRITLVYVYLLYNIKFKMST